MKVKFYFDAYPGMAVDGMTAYAYSSNIPYAKPGEGFQRFFFEVDMPMDGKDLGSIKASTEQPREITTRPPPWKT